MKNKYIFTSGIILILLVILLICINFESINYNLASSHDKDFPLVINEVVTRNKGGIID